MKKLKQDIWFPDPIIGADEVYTAWAIGELNNSLDPEKSLNHFHFYKKNGKENHLLTAIVYSKRRNGCILCGKVPTKNNLFQIELLENTIKHNSWYYSYFYIMHSSKPRRLNFSKPRREFYMSNNSNWFEYNKENDNFIWRVNKKPIKINGALDRDLRTFRFFLEYYNKL